MKIDAENLHLYDYDAKLSLSDPEFGQKLHKHHYDADIAKTTPFPTDFILAQFAQQAYVDSDFSLPDGWKILTIASSLEKANGYIGIAAWNPKLCQIAVAHRGTKISNIGALISDAQLALKKEHVIQLKSAASFVYLISEQVKVKNSEAGPRFQLSITGHSLGAWLAQLTTFTLKYFKRQENKFVEDKDYLRNIHGHTVVFESPGCRETMIKLVEKSVPRYSHRKYGNFDSLDMTVYLSKLNPINSINRHVGTIYMVPAKTHAIKEILSFFNSETHKIPRDIVLDFQSGILASCKLIMKNLLPFSQSPKHLRIEPADDNACSLNVFTEDELDFVKDWLHVLPQGSLNVQQFKEKNAVPEFVVNYEYNLFRAENLDYTIACVKNLRPRKKMIFELLKQDVDDRAYYEIFKLEAQHFQRGLLNFHGFFKDKYDLKEFLTSNNQILHIRLDGESTLDYELETSILNNVFCFYKKNGEIQKYHFLNWSKLSEMMGVLPNIIDKNKGEFNVLIVECFEANQSEEQLILRFLQENALKLIIITTDEFCWSKKLKGKIKEVCGFGSNLIFQDLTEGTQKRLFMEQQNLSLNKRRMSLSQVIELDFPFNDEVYERINKAFPTLTLFELMLKPFTEIVTMDCPFNNPLKRVVLYHLYQEIDVHLLLNLNDEQALFVIQDDENQLSQDIINKTTTSYIKIHADFENECLENPNKTIYLITVQNSKLYLTKIYNKQFYLHRNIIINKHINPLLFYDSDSNIDQYYFCGDKDKFKLMVSDVIPEQKLNFKFMHSENQAKAMVQNSKTNAHLMRIEEDITWLYSRGNMDSLRKYLSPKEIRIRENEAVQNDILVISGEPGMGKSSTIGNLFMELQKTHWVFALPLQHCDYDDLSEISFDSASRFILKSCGMSVDNCVEHLLAYCLKNAIVFPIYLMFDAYDEIRDKNSRAKFVALVNFLRDFSRAKILITTRKFKCKELENGISVFASHYEGLNKEAQIIDFFSSFWNSQLKILETGANLDKIRGFATIILANAQNQLGDTISNLIGIPMQLRMIAEVIPPPISSLDTETKFANILNLYEKYTETHYNVYFNKSNLPKNEIIKKLLSESISAKLYKLALGKMFNLDMDADCNDLEELNKVGLIQSNSYESFNYEFLHDSVRDYFVTYMLKLWLEAYFQLFHSSLDVTRFIVSDLVLKEEYREARFFLNSYMEGFRISKIRLKMCRSEVERMWKNDQSLLYYNQESFFHVCIKENLCFLTKRFLFQIVDGTNKTKLLGKRNSDLKTPIYIALDQKQNQILNIILRQLHRWSDDDIKTVLLATLFTHFTSDRHIDTLSSLSKNYPNIQKILQEIRQNFQYIEPFLEACKLDNLDSLNQTLKQFQNDQITRYFLLRVTNQRKETCLHLTSKKEITSRLLKLGADTDLQDHHGMTPLSRSIKASHSDIAAMLIKKHSTLIPDLIGNSPLLHAAKYGNDEVVKLLLNPKIVETTNVDEENHFGMTPLMIAAKNGHEVIVKYLLDKGADVFASDWNGMTPLYHAIKGNHTKFINVFRKKGADVNVQDTCGYTPLLYSIRKQRWVAVISLLDNGADVNISDRSGVYPLQLLIGYDRQVIVRKILEKEVKKSKQGDVLFTRDGAKIDMLTKEEQKYVRNLQNSKKKT